MNRQRLRFLTITLALLFVAEGFFGFPGSQIFGDQTKVNTSFFVAITLLYAVCWFLLAKRRVVQRGEYSLPVRGELLLHLATIFILISGFALLQVSTEDDANHELVRFVIIGCGGFSAIAWLSVVGIVIFGPESERAKIDTLLRGSTFTK